MKEHNVSRVDAMSVAINALGYALFDTARVCRKFVRETSLQISDGGGGGGVVVVELF